MSAESSSTPRARLVPRALWFVAAALALAGVALATLMRAENEMLQLAGVGGTFVVVVAVAIAALACSAVFAPWARPALALRLVAARWAFLAVALVVAALVGILTDRALVRWRVHGLERDTAALRAAIEADVTRTGAPPWFLEGTFGRVATGAGLRLGGAQVVYTCCADSEHELDALVYDLGPVSDETMRPRYISGATQAPRSEGDTRRSELVVVLDAAGRVANVAPERVTTSSREEFVVDTWLAHADRRAAMSADLAWNDRLAGCYRADVLARLGPSSAERKVRDTAWELEAHFPNGDRFCYRPTGAYAPFMRRVGGWGFWRRGDSE